MTMSSSGKTIYKGILTPQEPVVPGKFHEQARKHRRTDGPVVDGIVPQGGVFSHSIEIDIKLTINRREE
jgi:hypothetical protein